MSGGEDKGRLPPDRVLAAEKGAAVRRSEAGADFVGGAALPSPGGPFTFWSVPVGRHAGLFS